MAEGGLLTSAQYNNKTKSTVLNYGVIIAKVILITNIHTRNINAEAYALQNRHLNFLSWPHMNT